MTLPSNISYGDLYRVRLGLFYGYLDKSTMKDFDQQLVEVIRGLGVADAGVLEDNEVAA